MAENPGKRILYIGRAEGIGELGDYSRIVKPAFDAKQAIESLKSQWDVILLEDIVFKGKDTGIESIDKLKGDFPFEDISKILLKMIREPESPNRRTKVICLQERPYIDPSEKYRIFAKEHGVFSFYSPSFPFRSNPKTWEVKDIKAYLKDALGIPEPW